MPDQSDHAGMAALSIFEALMLAMNDRKLLPEHEIVGVLRDAEAAHANATGSETEEQTHRAVAALIHQMISGGNSVRRPQG